MSEGSPGIGVSVEDGVATVRMELPRGNAIGPEFVTAMEAALSQVLHAREQGIDATGPYSPDTIFLAARDGKYDVVVAMYHDQGLIPVKLLAFDQAVNVTIGLPTIRTSPDHGTAFDIVGRNRANPGSMRAAIELAIDMAVKCHARQEAQRHAAALPRTAADEQAR